MARYYHTEQAVFLSLDPLTDSDESVEMANGYTYAINNPVMLIDSTGLVTKPDGFESVYNTGIGGGGRSYASAGLGGGSRSGNTSAPRLNTVKSGYTSGTAVEQYLAKIAGGTSQVYFRTSLGGRYVDQLSKGRIAHESKVGYTSLSKRIRVQIDKDAILIRQGKIKRSQMAFLQELHNPKSWGIKTIIRLFKKERYKISNP